MNQTPDQILTSIGGHCEVTRHDAKKAMEQYADQRITKEEIKELVEVLEGVAPALNVRSQDNNYFNSVNDQMNKLKSKL